MGTATVEVSGAYATQWAADLHAVLEANAEPGDRVLPVEVDRSAELVVAVIGLVFAGVGTAKTLWDWWQAGRRENGAVKVQFSDGTTVELSGANLEQLEIVFQQADTQQS